MATTECVLDTDPKIREYLLKRARPSTHKGEESGDREDVKIKALEVIEQPAVSSYEISADTEAPTRVAVVCMCFDSVEHNASFCAGSGTVRPSAEMSRILVGQQRSGCVAPV